MRTIKSEIVFAIPAHGREDILHQVILDLKAKSEKYLKLDYSILVCSDWESDCFDIAALEMTEFTHHDNSNLGRKFNHLMHEAANYGRYIVLLGSDDLLTKAYFQELNNIVRHDAVCAAGLKSALFCGVQSLEVYQVNHRDDSWVGSGMVVRDFIVDELRGEIFPEIDKGLDRSGQNKIKNLIKLQRKQYGNIDPVKNGIICLKEVDNIHNFAGFKKGHRLHFEDLDTEDQKTIINIKNGHS